MSASLPMYGKDKNKNRSAVGLISLMDPVVSDQSDLEFWLHLIWRMGIWGVLIFRLGYQLPQRPCVQISVTHIFARPHMGCLPCMKPKKSWLRNWSDQCVNFVDLLLAPHSDQLDLEFWLHLVWRMGIWGVLIFRLRCRLPQRPCAYICYPYIW